MLSKSVAIVIGSVACTKAVTIEFNDLGHLPLANSGVSNDGSSHGLVQIISSDILNICMSGALGG